MAERRGVVLEVLERIRDHDRVEPAAVIELVDARVDELAIANTCGGADAPSALDLATVRVHADDLRVWKALGQDDGDEAGAARRVEDRRGRLGRQRAQDMSSPRAKGGL